MTRTDDHDPPTTVPLLRSAEAVGRYLATYPELPAECPDCPRIDLEEWQRQGDDADEGTFQRALRWGVPLLSAREFHPDAQALAQLTPELARRLQCVPLQARDGLLAVAMADVGDARALEQLNFLMRQRVVPMAATAQAIRQGIARHFDRAEDTAVVRLLGLDPESEAIETTATEAERLSREQPVVRIVHDLISGAIRRRASDIHLRPGEHGLDALYRIDDELVHVRRFMRALAPAVISRVKVLASMNLAEHRRPQDGRASFVLDDGRKVDMRVSILPAVFGESVVVRLLDANQGMWSVDKLGLSDTDRRRLQDVMEHSHGMFLVTGPTGSGKSTTLYAMLLELRKQRINILTIEDPVEFHIEDIQQMQVNRAAGFTFASALRNFLRHDPDVIMVGEIRDHETAEIGVESALTGHLVLSTLHTNTAAATVTRLLDLGVESYLLRASLLAVMSQRLVRRTCVHCKEVEQVHPHIRERLGVSPEEVFYVGRGCSHCDGLGVRGRRAVYELLVVSSRIQSLVQPGVNADQINRAAIEEGMTSITDAAVAVAREGIISLAEAWRVRAD